MGYPMTFQRVVKRSRLENGDYNNLGDHAFGVNVDHPGLMGDEEFHVALWPYAVERIKGVEGEWRMLLGDLRRLERDATDEGSICTHICNRTGIDADTVAAVLKEFMSI